MEDKTHEKENPSSCNGGHDRIFCFWCGNGRRRSRTVRFTLTWNFGSSKGKRKLQEQEDEENAGSMNGYDDM